MTEEWLSRTEILLGQKAIARIQQSRVYVFGLGAVGSYVVEGLARSGIGMVRLIDFDTFKPSNLNRQLNALHSTMGKAKAEVAGQRVHDINPNAEVDVRVEFAHVETLPALLSGQPDLIIDAVDSVNPKVEIIAAAAQLGIPVYSSMGAATRIDAERIRFSPLFDATMCPLARIIRKRLRRRGIDGELYCVYSDEPRRTDAIRPPEQEGEYDRGRARRVLGSVATITGMFGLRLAHEALLGIIKNE